MKAIIVSFVLLLSVPAVGACQDGGAVERGEASGEEVARTRTVGTEPEPRVPATGRVSPLADLPGPSEEAAARAAWAYIERNWHDGTGLVGATESYDFLTTWDLGSVIAATYSAHQLGLIGDEQYRRRMSATLATLGELELFDGAAFNKSYDASTGGLVDRRDRPSSTGYGWSVLDLGRVLAWLKIVEARDPEHAAAARAVAERFDYSRLIADGYLVGANMRSDHGIDTYPEGRLGYEQYAARAFALWGHEAPKSADPHLNAKPVEVMGQVIHVDKRGGNRITSEPFVMAGMELGWPEYMREQAVSVLAAQRARHESTGVVTMVSEDAMAEPPYYFYYYCVYCADRAFTVDAQGARQPLDGPRWVSAKAAYGWHALLPDDYTALAVETVAPAFVEDRGWFSGVYERSGQRAGSMNLNTAAMILEALAYRKTGRPFLDG